MADNKGLKPQPGAAPPIAPREALRVASQVAPRQPPAVAPVPAEPQPQPRQPAPPPDRSAMLSMRFRESTLESLAVAARRQGLTQKQLVARALASAGVEVAPADAEDRPPPRRRGQEA
jgi:hypothetical protein